MLRQKRFTESMTFKIICVNVVVFILFLIMQAFYDMNYLVALFALQPAAIISGEKLWTLISSMFLHIEIWHLAVNMISLYYVGIFVEQLIGKKRFLGVYLLSGVFAGLFWTIVSNYLSLTPILTRVFGNPLIYGVGASGAIFGMVGVLAVLTPNSRVSFIAGPIVALVTAEVVRSLSIIPIGLMTVVDLLVFVYFFFTIFAMMSFNPEVIKWTLPVETNMVGLAYIAIIPLVLVSIFVDLPIGNMAHLGGLLSGVFYATYLKRRYPRRSKMIAGMFR